MAWIADVVLAHELAQELRAPMYNVHKHGTDYHKYFLIFLFLRARSDTNNKAQKDSANKTWCDTDLHSALIALKKKEISVNKASKVYGIPSSVSTYLIALE